MDNKQPIQFKIPKPCSENWNNMEPCGKNTRFCSNCERQVFDIRNLNTERIEELYRTQKKGLCVIASKDQVNKSYRTKLLSRAGILAGILLSFLFVQKMNAQSVKQPGAIRIEQAEKTTDTITILGTVKRKTKLGWKKVKNELSLNIYSGDSLLVKEFYDENKGTFTIRLPKRDVVNDAISIEIYSPGYEKIEIENISFKDTHLEIYAEEKQIHTVCGRFF